MKNCKVIRALFIGVIGVGTSSGVYAACGGSIDQTIDVSGTYNNMPTTCGKNAGFANSICNGGTTFDATGIAFVEIKTGNTPQAPIAFTVTGSGFNPDIAVVGPNCTSACNPTDATNGTNTVTYTPTGGILAANSTFYLVVGASDGSGCGQYNLLIGGTLPVELQGFSVE